MAGLEGQVIGGCRIIRRLGDGGMGEVYLAEQISLKRQVAIKLVRPEVEAAVAGGSGTSLAERFAREAQAIAAMEHPHILPVYDFGEQDGLAYLVMAYAPNGSLQQALTPGHPAFRFGLPLSLDLMGVMLDQAAQALQHAHERGVLHRDVKPANFLMGAGSPIHLLLADFGLAKFTTGAANSGVYSGTAAYSAPEQIQRQAVPASDQYSLAVMTFLLLTGQLPFQGGVLELVTQQLATPAPSLRSLNPVIPAEVDAVVLRALAKRPEDRWPSVIVFAAAYRDACVRARGSAAALPVVAPPLAQPLPGQPGAPQVIAPPLPPAPPAGPQFSPPLAATQVAQATPAAFPLVPPERQTVAQAGWAGDDSFVAAGPTPLAPMLPPSAPPRRSRTGWLALAGVVGVALAIVLIVALLNGHQGSSAGQQTNMTGGLPGLTVTPGQGGTAPVSPGGTHIKSLQTGLTIDGDVNSPCQNIKIAQATTSFNQSSPILVVFAAVSDGNPNAEAWVALINSEHQLLQIALPDIITCPGTALYPSALGTAAVPPGQYDVGVFYSEDFMMPQQPEVVIPITISAS